MTTPQQPQSSRSMSEAEIGVLIDRAYESREILLPFVLEEANDIRMALAIGEGKLPELPQGIMEDTKHCVLANALSNGWQCTVDNGGMSLVNYDLDQEAINRATGALVTLGYKAETYSGGVHIQHTRFTGLFIEWFDSGYYPELILQG